MSNVITLDSDTLRVAERRLFAARADYRDALEESDRARQLLLDADRAYRRLVDPKAESLDP